MPRAISSSCSSRSFCAFCRSRSSMLVVMVLNDDASSPSWSCDGTAILCEKSPWRTCSVPSNNACTAPVMERASANPIT